MLSTPHLYAAATTAAGAAGCGRGALLGSPGAAFWHPRPGSPALVRLPALCMCWCILSPLEPPPWALLSLRCGHQPCIQLLRLVPNSRWDAQQGGWCRARERNVLGWAGPGWRLPATAHTWDGQGRKHRSWAPGKVELGTMGFGGQRCSRALLQFMGPTAWEATCCRSARWL